MINEFKDFKLLINLGFSGEEIFHLSYNEHEREFIYYTSYCDSAGNILDITNELEEK